MEDTYHGVLQVAEAAREAGSLLRQDLLKLGGPSGHDGHAKADEPAEHLIRQRLLASAPAWGYLGEETGREPQVVSIGQDDRGCRLGAGCACARL